MKNKKKQEFRNQNGEIKIIESGDNKVIYSRLKKIAGDSKRSNYS